MAVLGVVALPGQAAERGPETTTCVGCHLGQAAPLARSRHGLASGPGLWGQLPTQGPHVGTSLSCLLCHAPAPDQQRWTSAAALAPPHPGQTALEARVQQVSAAATRPNPAHAPGAERLGVSCTACHLEGNRIVGSGSGSAPHPWSVSASLADPALCARCHQFGSAAAVGGKPLENTYAEWKSSRWGEAGATCQSCHMPGGEHLFQGIHTPDLVRTGVELRWQSEGTSGALVLANTNVGHAFPTYATPRVVLSVQAEDAQGRPVGKARALTIGREVRFEDGAWKELSDTRVQAGAEATLAYRFEPDPRITSIHAVARVEPDFGYVAIYRDLQARPGLPPERVELLRAALEAALKSPYVIFDERRELAARARPTAAPAP